MTPSLNGVDFMAEGQNSPAPLLFHKMHKKDAIIKHPPFGGEAKKNASGDQGEPP